MKKVVKLTESDLIKLVKKIINEDVNEGLTGLVGALGIGLSSLGSGDGTTVNGDTKKEVVKDVMGDFLNDFTTKHPDTLKKPHPISLLELEFGNYIKTNKLNLSLNNLNSLSGGNLPFEIKYFYVNGLDNIIPILNINYMKAIKVYGHDVKFSFTRTTGVNSFGVNVNF